MKNAVITVGASAGGVKALTTVVSGLPPDLPAALFVVLHIPPDRQSFLVEILDKASPLEVASARDGERLAPGRIRVAIPDRHLVIDDGTTRLLRSATENRHRPAIDPLFRSAARAYGQSAIGVLLTGTLDDGAAGLIAIKERGGTTIVQDPDDAEFPEMPLNALRWAPADHVVPLARIPGLLVELLEGAVPGEVEGKTEPWTRGTGSLPSPRAPTATASCRRSRTGSS